MMLLLRPSADTFRRIEKAVVANLPNPECPLGFDQPVLTRVFRKKWRPIANWTQLKATTKCMRKNKIPPQIDAVHFFGTSAPWSAACGRCVASGRACSSRVSWPGHPAVEPCMAPHLFAAQKLWWESLLDCCSKVYAPLLVEHPELTYCIDANASVAALPARRPG